MAKQKNNVVTCGLSGKIGDLLIFCQINGKTVISKIPERSKTVTEKQVATCKRFRQATLYAKAAVANPETEEQYADAAKKGKDKGRTAYNVADFFNAPDIDTIDLSNYTGAVGDEIRVIASDDFAVKSACVDEHIEIGAYRMGYRMGYRIPYRIAGGGNENYEFYSKERFKIVLIFKLRNHESYN